MKRYISFFLLNIFFVLLAPSVMFGSDFFETGSSWIDSYSSVADLKKSERAIGDEGHDSLFGDVNGDKPYGEGSYNRPMKLPSLPADSHYQLTLVHVQTDISFNPEEFRSYVLKLAEAFRKEQETDYKSPIKMENNFYRVERPKVGKNCESAMIVYRLSMNNQVVRVDFFQQETHISPRQFARDVLLFNLYFVVRN